jgi:hypothetical protein
MRCEYCGREGCPARAGTYFDSADDAARALHDCRAAARDRALRAEAELRAMQAEAEKWAHVGWRDVPEQDAAIAAGCNRAAEAILVAKENNR